MVVPGPGVLTAAAGLATAYACNARMLFLAGQIGTKQISVGLGALHELPDQSSLLRSLSKFHGLARSPNAIAQWVNQACGALHAGRPRPAVVELPPDVLHRTESVASPAPIAHAPLAPSSAEVAHAVATLRAAVRVAIVAGGGVLAAGASKALALVAERLDAPVLVTEGGASALGTHHPLALPWLASRRLLEEVDAVLIVGTRFVDGSAGDHLHADARLALEAIAAELGATNATRDGAAIASTLRRWCDEQLADLVPQREWLRHIRAGIPEDGHVVFDLTQVGYLAPMLYPTYAPSTILGAGYQGSLGFAFPTALGVAVGHPDRASVAVVGDGGFGWALAEPATAKRYALPVVVVVFNDNAFGNVRRMQRNQFGRVVASDLVNPDFLQLANAFGVDAARVETPERLQAALASAIAGRRPTLIEVPVGEMPDPWHLLRRGRPRPVPVAGG